MSFEKTLTTMMQWVTATEALAALGAELALQQPDVNPPPEIAAAVLNNRDSRALSIMFGTWEWTTDQDVRQ